MERRAASASTSQPLPAGTGYPPGLPPTSLLARTTGTSSFSSLSHTAKTLFTGPSSAPNSHARAYLDALVPPLRRSTILQRTTSALSTTSYKPQKPSSLASGASVTGSDSDEDNEAAHRERVIVNSLTSEDRRAHNRERVQYSAGRDAEAPNSSSTSGTSNVAAASPAPQNDVNLLAALDQVTIILTLLDDAAMDEEQKIEKVRDRLGMWLEDIEGVKPVSGHHLPMT